MVHKAFSVSTYKMARQFLFAPFLGLGVIISMTGLWVSFFGSPLDYQQKETVRIMYIHVPASWLALSIYTFMGFSSLGGFVWRHSMGFMFARAAWPIGFTMGLISLLTGSIWGQPMWGTWWVWDARLTSMLMLVLMYLGYGLFMQTGASSGGNPNANTTHSTYGSEQAHYERGSLFLCIGLLNLPIIKYSVEWWSTLHQPASLSASLTGKSGSAIASGMLWPLGLSFFGLLFLSLALGLIRVDTLLLRQKRRRSALIQDRMSYIQNHGDGKGEGA